MSECHGERAGRGPATESKQPVSATSIDVDPAELAAELAAGFASGLAGADSTRVVVLAFIVSCLAEGHERAPAEVGRHQPTVAPLRERESAHPTGWSNLTDREKAIASLAGRALTNQQIATRLGISPHTVNFHLRQIFRKLGIVSRVELARISADQSG